MKNILFALIVFGFVSGCAAPREVGVVPTAQDPFEKTNRAIFKFNDGVYDYVYDPIITTYKFIFPKFIRTRFHRFFSNLSELSTITNSLLQGKGTNAAASAGRFVVNSSVGIGGLFDVATDAGLNAEKERFNNVLMKYDIAEGPIITIPFLYPTSVRSGVSIVGDIYIDPVYYLLPGVIGNGGADFYAYYGIKGLTTFAEYSDFIEQGRKSGLDNYALMIKYTRMAQYAHLDGLPMFSMKIEGEKPKQTVDAEPENSPVKTPTTDALSD